MKWVWGYYWSENISRPYRVEPKKDLSSLRLTGVKLCYGNQNFKLWGLTLLAGNNRELSGGPPCRSASWALTRLSDQPGNKSHGWVLNSLLADPMQGAGDDWWEGFPVMLWDWRKAGTGLFLGLRYECKRYLFRHTFSFNSNYCFHKYFKEMIKI